MTETQRVRFITGCCSGFGRAHAQAVIAHGNKLIATARNVETLHDLTAQALDRALGRRWMSRMRQRSPELLIRHCQPLGGSMFW